MTGSSQPAMNTVNSHSSKTDVVKFDGTKNFDMWRCEVMNMLTASNLEHSLRLKEKSEETSE